MSSVGDRYRLRTGTPEDAPTMQATVLAGFETYRAFAPEGWNPPPDGGAEGIRTRVEREETWVLMGETPGGDPAGHVAITPASASRWNDKDPELVHLWQLFVREAHWGSGLATELLARSRDESRQRGYAAMRLYTPAQQTRARRFYEREGFKRTSAPILEAKLGLEVVEYRAAL